MENTSNPSLKESHLRKLVFFSADFKQNYPHLLDEWDHLSSAIRENCQFEIKTNHENIEIFNLNKENSLLVQEQNFNFTFKKILRLNLSEKKERKLSSYNLTSLIKNKTIWNEAHHLRLTLNQIFADSNTTDEFLRSLFSLDFFKSFETMHTFIHEKGTVSAKHFVSTSQETKSFSQTVSEFTALLLAIKKSKNRSFGQSTLKASNFQIIGTCLAKEFSLQRYNFIFVLSKNDFLPQTDSDIEKFNFFCEILESYFELILAKEFNQTKTKEIKLALNTLPLSLKINKGKEILFKKKSNQSFDRHIIKNDLELHYKRETTSQISHADVHHHERVSLLGELLNTLKHELSNPLFGLQLSTDLLMLEDLEEDQSMMLQEISTSLKRSHDIISNFSNLYQEQVEFSSVPVKKLISEVLTLTKSESRAIPKNIHIENESEEIQISSNSTWLAQIIFNLVINSAQALNEQNLKSPQIDITIKSHKASLLIHFTDNGNGLSQDQVNNAFTPFYTTKEKGTGLGLSISQSLAKKLGGELSYNSSYTNGAQFILELPL